MYTMMHNVSLFLGFGKVSHASMFSIDFIVSTYPVPRAFTCEYTRATGIFDSKK